MVDSSDTICALSSAHGRSGIAVVRVSGAAAFDLVGRVFRAVRPQAEIADRRAVLGRILDPRDGSEIDEGLVTCFRSPRSYTGEDVAEFSVHGSPVVVALLLESLCAAGARPAEPGEFTLRAFLNGRMDLAQAEAVRDLIEAQTRHQLQVAARQRAGELSHRLAPVKQEWLDVVVGLETAVEFEEEGLALESAAATARRLQRLREELTRWIDSFRRGRIVRDGFSLAVVGRPNAGKSSLFNALLAEERSIVTEIPGTTRDLVSEYTDIGGIPVRLIDTAGLRAGEGLIEQIGVERSLRALADVDAVLLVADTSRPYDAEDTRLREQLEGRPCLLALNKSDLPREWTAAEEKSYTGPGPWARVSAKTGEGLPQLREAIRGCLMGDGGAGGDGLLVTNLRHCRCLQEARDCLDAAAGALAGGLSEEFVLADLHRGLRKLGEITGETGVEELLGAIFARFCIGK